MELSQLLQIASRFGFSMNPIEARAMISELKSLLHSAKEIDMLSAQYFPAQHSNSDHKQRNWWNPSPDSNPYNAWFVRCSINSHKKDPNQTSSMRGKRVAVKDTIGVAGLPLAAGSRLLSGFVCQEDATVVTRLLDCGATLLGKTNCEALGASSSSHTSDFGPVVNPAPALKASAAVHSINSKG